MIDIKGLNKADVLTALYDNARCLGSGVFDYRPGSLRDGEAEELLAKRTYFDYLYGRVMKVDLSDDKFEEYLYDRDNGEGAAQRVINKLREETNNA